MMFGSLAMYVLFVSLHSAIPMHHFQMDKDNPHDGAIEITVREDLSDDFRDLLLELHNEDVFSIAKNLHTYKSEASQFADDYSIRKRRKRSPISLLAAKGLMAVKLLMIGAKETKFSSRRYRSFEKTGDFETARADFYSVFPSNVKYRTGATLPMRTFEGRSYSGTVGDRRIFLREFGVKADGYRPTIEVTETMSASGPYVNKIVYKNKDKP